MVLTRYFHKNINFCVQNSIFLPDLKVADVTPAFKKNQRLQKITTDPLAFYLIYLKYMKDVSRYNQMHTYSDDILSKYQCGFLKGFNAQHWLVSMIEKWKESVDNGWAFGVLMTDLSKAFDCLHHGLLIAKLKAYGFGIKSVKLIQQHVSNRKQRVKVGNAYSSWKIFYGIPQVHSLVCFFSVSFCVTYFISLKVPQ